MSDKSDLIPFGFVTFQATLSQIADVIANNVSVAGENHQKCEASSANINEMTIDYIRKALFDGKLLAFHYVGDELQKIPAGTWRNLESELWIQDGERHAGNGHLETLFIQDHSLQNCLKRRASEIQEPRITEGHAFYDGKSFYVSPFIALMIEAIIKFDIPNKTQKLDTLIKFFEGRELPNGSKISKHHAHNLATFCRPAELMTGGLKPSHGKGERFNP